ncbi:MAG TPA: hypothetical protein VHC49_26000 [Mycobacteriales bacterium]|nr:hypothetical protein [Mycobacteriales bacterium]
MNVRRGFDSIVRLARRPAVRLASVVVALVGVTIGVLVSQQVLPGTVTAGPLHRVKGGTGTGSPVDRSGVWTGVVEATFDGDKAAYVTSLTVIPVPGFPTPKLIKAGYITNSTYGSSSGPPKTFFRYEPLVHVPIRPTDNRHPPATGIMVVLRAGRKPGTYAIEGVEIKYTIGSTRYRSRLYTTVGGCVPPPHRDTCPSGAFHKAFDRMLTDSGG